MPGPRSSLQLDIIGPAPLRPDIRHRMITHLLNRHRSVGATNDKMRQSLRKILVPELRARGFKGSLPHFRRIRESRVDLLGIQFNKYGGSFVVEIASSAPEGLELYAEKIIPAEEARHWHMGWDERLRLGSKPGRISRDHWFKFRKGIFIYWFSYDSVARSILPFLDLQAEPYWKSHGKKAESTSRMHRMPR